MRGHLGDLDFLLGGTALATLAAPATAATAAIGVAVAVAAAVGIRPATAARGGVDRIAVQHDAAPAAVRTRGGERLDQAGAEPFTGQLHQPQRRHLRHLVPGTVTGQRLGQPSQHQVTVRFEHHVDEIDDHDAADVAQPELPHDLLGGLQVVPGHRLLEVATRSGELAGVDVDDRHRLRAVDHQGAARREPHLAVHRLGQLLVDAVHREHVGPVGTGRLVALHPGQQFRSNAGDVVVDRLPGVVSGHDQLGEILVEQISDHLDQHVGLFVERHGRTGLLLGDLGGLGLDLGPPLLQPLDVTADVVFFDAFGRGADDHAGVRRHHLAQDLLQPLPFGIGQLAADAGGGGAGHVDQVAAGKGDLRGQPGTLVSDRILADLHDYVVAGFERLFDLALGAAETGSLPVHLAGVEHTVAAATDVDERRLHRRKHVLHDAEVDVADQGHLRRRGDEMFDDDAVLHHRDLGVASTLVRRLGTDLVPHHHRACDGLAPGEELGLGQDRGATPTRIAAVPAALTLGLQAGGAADALDLGVRRALRGLAARLALVDDRVGRIVGRRIAVVVVVGAGLAAATAAAATGRTLRAVVVLSAVVVGVIGVSVGFGGLPGLGRRLVVVAARLVTVLFTTATATAATPPAPAFGRRPAGRVIVGVGVRFLVRVGRRVVLCGGVVPVLVVVATAAVGAGGAHHRLRRDEQRQVVGRFGLDRGRFGLDRGRRLQDQPRLRLLLGGRVGLLLGNRGRFRRWFGRGFDGLGLGCRLRLGQRRAYPVGLLAADRRVCAAGAPVELDERVDDAPARRPQHPGQGVHPQAFGCRRCGSGRLGRLRLFGRSSGGVVQIVTQMVIVGHVFSSSPRARRLLTRPREGF